MIRSFIACLVVLIFSACSAVENINGRTCDVSPSVLVADFAESKGIPGMAVVVGVRGRLEWSHGYGVADVATSARVRPSETMFRIGSTSKTLTAFVLAKLAQENRLDIDGKIIEFLPNLPEAYKDITLRQLAGHLGGVRHYNSMAELGSNVEYQTTREALEIFINDPLVASPGDNYEYSTYGFTLIAAVLEAAMDKTYLSLMSQELFTPLDMQHTSADLKSIIVPKRTEFYYLDDAGKLTIGPEINSSYKYAGGGFLASVADLAHFGMKHFDDAVLTPDSRALLWTTQQSTNGTNTDYGVGWFTSDRWVEHPGGALGGSTLLRIYPEEQTVVALAANLSMLGPNRFGELPDQLLDCIARE